MLIEVLLQEYISLLLHEHNCVIVPEFGGFVANYKSAVLEEFSKKIHPPSKSVLFNPLLTTNDGLLGNYISVKQKIDYSSSLEFISKGVSEWNEQLANNERIEFGEIGFLYQKNGKIQFEQSRETNLLLAAYGLRSIDFVRFVAEKVESRRVTATVQRPIEKKVEPVVEKPIEVQVETVVKKIAETKKIDAVQLKKHEDKNFIVKQQKLTKPVNTKKAEIDEIKPERRNVFGTVLKYTAAAVFVPVLFYSYWIPMETDALDTGLVQFSDFNPIHTQAERTYDLRHDVSSFEEIETVKSWDELTENIEASVYNFELLEDFYVPVSLQKEEVAFTAEVDKTNVEDSNTIQTNTINEVQSGNFHVISGCFSVQNNATNLVSDLNGQGFNAQILDKKGGLHRVSAGAFTSKEEAKSAVSKLESSGFSGWVLKY